MLPLINNFLESSTSDEMFEATNALGSQLRNGTKLPREVLQKVSDNLGDDLASLRKASHSFFQKVIRMQQTFTNVISAMVNVGLVSLNNVVRQKNCNSLQSLLISDSSLLEWNDPILFQAHDILCKRMQDSSVVVSKAAEQTVITLIKLEGYQQLYYRLPIPQQDQVQELIDANPDKVKITLKQQKFQETMKPQSRQNDPIFNTPPKLSHQKIVEDQYPITQSQQSQQPINISTASSSRSDVSQNLANRLKNKGEMLATKNTKSNDISYTPSLMEKHNKEREIGSSYNSEEEPQYFPEKKRMNNQNQQQFDETAPKSLKKTPNQYQEQDDYDKSKMTSKPFRITRNTTNYRQQEETEDEQQQQVQKVSSSSYSKPFQKRTGGGVPTVEDKYTQPVYLSEQELESVPNHEAVAKQLISDFKTDDWQKLFQALNTMRRLIKHHPATLKKNNLQALLVEATKHMDNLRSGVSKNSLLTMFEASARFKKDLDVVLDTAVTKLVKKSIDSNAFISEEVRRVMVQITLNCTEQKSVAIIQNIYQSKSMLVRLNIAYCIKGLLQKLVETQRVKSPEFERLFQLLMIYMVDQAVEVRNLAKESTFDLYDQLGKQQADQLVGRYAPDKELLKIKQIIERGRPSDGTSSDMKRFQSITDDGRVAGKTPELRPRVKEEYSPISYEQQQTTQAFKKATPPMKMTSTTKGFQKR